MTHPGLPWVWGAVVWAVMLALSAWALMAPMSRPIASRYYQLNRLPLIGNWIKRLNASPWPLVVLKLILVMLFVLVIIAGVKGTPIPERNLATVLTWNIWWTGLIIMIFFLGSAWCAVCPWDALAQWLVRRRLWRRASSLTSLNLRVPKQLRNVWPALGLFVGLTWLELGVGVTTSPYATALLALLMVVLATVSLALFERKAFCRYFCPVGRTVGFYAQLAPVELRPINTDICVDCKTLDCYHGNDKVEPCPTHLLMGTLKQNTYCTSCGNCTQSCPHDNISWRLRPPGMEAIQNARPHWDEAWFMLGLLGLTVFHGVTMMPFWEEGLSIVARILGDSGQLLWSFSLGLLLGLAVPVLLYTLCVGVSYYLTRGSVEYKRLFSGLVFMVLPLAFAYHLAHNLTHLVRESDGLAGILANPLGSGTLPLSMAEKHARHMELLIPQDMLFFLQTALMVFGFWIAVQVLRHRGRNLFAHDGRLAGWRLFPMLSFAIAVTGVNLWLLVQPMTMRM